MSLVPRRFVLIRHGETDANRAGRIAGRTEARLTDAGRAGAAALAGRRWPEITLFVSPQTRAQDTARLAFPGRTALTLADLRERDWGDFEGRPVADLPPRESTPAGGEAWSDMIARVARALTHGLTRTGEDSLPVFVAHSGVIRAARHLLSRDPFGPSPRNTTPILFLPGPSGWHETGTTGDPATWPETGGQTGAETGAETGRSQQSV